MSIEDFANFKPVEDNLFTNEEYREIVKLIGKKRDFQSEWFSGLTRKRFEAID